MTEAEQQFLLSRLSEFQNYLSSVTAEASGRGHDAATTIVGLEMRFIGQLRSVVKHCPEKARQIAEETAS